MAMAEVAAANPSHTSAAGSTVPAVANSTSSKSPTIFSLSPSSTLHANPLDQQASHTQAHHHQQPSQPSQGPPQQQQQHQHQSSLQTPQYTTSSPSGPGDANTTATFPPHWSQSGQMQFSSPDRNVSRGLPPIMSPMMGISPGSHSNHDMRQPVSPRTVPLGMNDPGQDLSAFPGDLTAPRKRSKVSRACDECRRKKIRCDATSESSNEQCSSCKRVGSKCSFSRVPMKRGPSKGYIKELADRLNTLENSISTGDLHSYGPGAPGDGEHSPGPSESTSPPPTQSGTVKQGRKRTLSSSSGFHNALHLQPLTQQPLTPRPSERLPSIDSFHTTHQHPPPSRQLPPPPHQPPPHQSPHQGAPQHSNIPSSASSEPTSSYRTHASPNGVFWKGISDSNRRASVSFPFDSTERQAASMNSTGSEQVVFDWDDEFVNQYYELIHPTFPLLPESKANLQSRLAETPASMRDAFLEALYSTVRSSPASRARGVSTSNARRASNLIISAQFECSATRSPKDNLICLQTLILMGLEADNHGPGSSGPPRAAWLGAAVGLVYNMKLHSNRLPREKLQAGDPDSDEKLGRRAWWVLVVLDRWHAISTSSPLFIPDSSVALLVEDQNVLGIALYHIARLSCIMGHLAESLTAADGEISTAYTSRLLRGELERFRETVEPLWAQRGSLGLVELAYYHVKLLSLRHASRTDPVQLLGPAIRIADIMSSAQNPTTPLSHHFAALALGTLLDLADFEETKKEACAGIETLMDALEKRRTTPARDEDGWDKAIKDLIERRRQPRYGAGGGDGSGPDAPRGHGSLQHLAELAVGERSPTAPTPGANYPTLPHLDMARLQRHGYLGSLVL